MLQGKPRQDLEALISDLIVNLNEADQPAANAAPQYVYDWDVDDGDDLPQNILDEYVAHWPSPATMWNTKDRNREMRPYLFPANFMQDRRRCGVPDIAVGPWAAELKRAPQGQAIINADKQAASTQKAIEEVFRPLLCLTQKLAHAEENNEQVDGSMLDDIFMVGKGLANATAFCEHNRIKSMLAVLKPGAEKEYSCSDSVGLMTPAAVEALQRIREAEKLQEKLKTSGQQPKKNARSQQNSRRRSVGAPPAGQSTDGASNPFPRQQQGRGQQGKGRGKGKGRN